MNFLGGPICSPGSGTPDRMHDAAPTTPPPAPPPASTPGQNRRAIVLIVVAAVLVAGTGLFVASRDRDPVADWAGTVLAAPQEKPDIVLTDTSGRPFDLRAETEGRLTILMFGYTNCPDVCPISLATLASTLEVLDGTRRQRIRVVFVTADPARDTPEVLRRYLDGFDSTFVGLTGTHEEIEEAQRAADVPVGGPEGQPDEDGSYTVGHATQLIVYQTDDQARIVYPFGTRQSDWARDLPRLLGGDRPTPA